MEHERNIRPSRRALGEWALDQLYDLIFTGALSAGTDLGEEEISERLGVSRATTSAALRQLEVDGLATVAAANGRRVVATFSIADIYDLYTVRSLLESHAAEVAAPEMTDAELEEMRKLQVEMEAIAKDRSDPTRRDFGVDFDFHRVIVRSAGSRRVETSLIPIWNQTHALLRHLYSIGVHGDAAEEKAAYHDHHAILDALTRRDGQAAARAMREHLCGRRDKLVASVQNAQTQYSEKFS